MTDAASNAGSALEIDPDPKADLHRYLRSARDALLWKLEGLSEYDVRRPLTPTGTNLLGLVKHLAGIEAGYFGVTFGRPFPEPLPGFGPGAEPNGSLWATPEESREQVLDLYRRACAHADATIEALSLEAVGEVAWWLPDRRRVTLHRIMTHVIAETHRHVGHADIVRELIDGAVGMQRGNDNLPPVDEGWWTAYRERVQQAAEQAAAWAS